MLATRTSKCVLLYVCWQQQQQQQQWQQKQQQNGCHWPQKRSKCEVKPTGSLPRANTECKEYRGAEVKPANVRKTTRSIFLQSIDKFNGCSRSFPNHKQTQRQHATRQRRNTLSEQQTHLAFTFCTFVPSGNRCCTLQGMLAAGTTLAPSVGN